MLFSITIYDFYINYKYYLEKKSLFLYFYVVFLLVFLLGVLNSYKDFGTDFPGVIICFYILIFYVDIIKNQQRINGHTNFIILLLLCNFAFMIKISNTLIYLLIFIIYFSLDNKIKLLKKIFHCKFTSLFLVFSKY